MASVSFQLIGTSIYLNFSASFKSDDNKSKTFRKNTNLSVNPSDWKTKKSRRKNKAGKNSRIVDLTNPKYAEAKEFKENTLEKIEKSVLDQYNKDYPKGIAINKDWFHAAVKKALNQSEDQTTLLTYRIQRAIEKAPYKKIRTKGGRYKIGLSKGRIKGIEQFKTIIERFEADKLNGTQINIPNIDKKLIEDFENWLFDQTYSKNYIGKQLSNFKAILNEIDDLKININVKKDIQVISDSKETDEIIYLSLDELQQIKEANIITPYLKNARKWLVLGCHTGQRASDLLRLSADKIELYQNRRVFRITQQKTNSKVTIPILSEVEKIIKDGFPYAISQTKLREYFKMVCRLAGIDEPTKGRVRQSGKHGTTIKGLYPKWKLIGTHVCRRSFASNYYGHMPTPILISITGHSSEQMFLNYIGKTDEDMAIQMFDYIDKMPKIKTLEVVKESTGTEEN